MNTLVTQNNPNIRRMNIRRILTGNAVFSGLSGLLLTAAAEPVANFLGLGNATAIFVTGWVALGYAALITYNLTRPAITPGLVLFTVIADSLWVLASILLLLTGWVPLSVEGKWAVGIVAVIVDVFATLQFIEWRKM